MDDEHTVAPGHLLEALAERQERVEAQLAEFHRRSAHREAMIDRLHEENQRLHGDLRQTILYPIVSDLIRLHDSLVGAAEATARAGDGASASAELIRSFASDVELTLDRCGIEPFGGEPGEPFRPAEHRALSVVPADRPELGNTIVEVVAVGFRELDGGRVRRPLHARFARYEGDAEPASFPPETTATEESARKC